MDQDATRVSIPTILLFSNGLETWRYSHHLTAFYWALTMRSSYATVMIFSMAAHSQQERMLASRPRLNACGMYISWLSTS